MPISDTEINAFVVNAIHTATTEIFSTMLGSSATPGEPYHSSEPRSQGRFVMAVVGLAGTFTGSGAVNCGDAAARGIAGALMMSEYPEVTEEVLDCIGETANMVIGNMKTKLEDQYGPMGLSIPTVIYGQDFMTRMVGVTQWLVMPFSSPLGDFRVQVLLKETGPLLPTDPAELIGHMIVRR